MAVQITQPGTTQVSTSHSSSYNFTDFDIGDAAEDRIVIAQITAHDPIDDVDVSSVTIGGVSATKIVGLATDEADGGPAVSSIWAAQVPSGTTADISFSLSNGAERASCAALRMVGASDDLTPWDTGTDEGGAGGSASVDIDCPANGAICAVVYVVNEATILWQNITELYDTVVESGNGSVSGAAEDFSSEKTALSVQTSGGDEDEYLVLAVASFRPTNKAQGQSDGVATTSFLSITAGAGAGSSDGEATVEGDDGSFFDPEIKAEARSEGSAVGQFVDPTFDWPRGVAEGSATGLFFPFGFISQLYLGDTQVPNLKWGGQQVKRVFFNRHLVFRDISATSSPMMAEGEATAAAVGDFEVPAATVIKEAQDHSTSSESTHLFNNVAFGSKATGDDRRFMVLVVGVGNGNNDIEVIGASIEGNTMDRVVHNEQPTGASRGASVAIFMLEYNEDTIGSIQYTLNHSADETAWVLYKVVTSELGEELIDTGVSEPGSNPAEMELETEKGSAVIAGMYANNTTNSPSFNWEGLDDTVIEKTEASEALSCASRAVQEDTSAYELEGELTSGQPSVVVGACVSIGP